jgi:hypothetical protein
LGRNDHSSEKSYVVQTDYETELTEARAHWGCRAIDDDDDDDDDEYSK